jgi:uncharacterized protein YecA (UPF0149 family)
MSLKSKIGTQTIRDGLTHEEVFELIGRMLFKLHAFEQLLRQCTAILIAANRNKPVDGEIDAIDLIWKMRKDPCGRLVQRNIDFGHT